MQRKRAGDALDHLRRWQHLVELPAVGRAHVHVLDEAQHDCATIALAEVARHRHDLAVVGAALDDHVDLDRPQTHPRGRLDAFEHVGHREVDVVHLAESGVVERVEAHGHALQAGVLERLRLAREQRAVGRQRQVEWRALGGAHRCQLLDQRLDTLAQQRLAAGQADLAHAQLDEHTREPADLLEAQERAVRQEAVRLAEHFLGHAVAASEVAAVGHRDAQIAQGAPVTVGQWPRRQVDGRGWRAQATQIEQGECRGHGELWLERGARAWPGVSRRGLSQWVSAWPPTARRCRGAARPCSGSASRPCPSARVARGGPCSANG